MRDGGVGWFFVPIALVPLIDSGLGPPWMILLIVATGLADWALSLVMALKAFGGYKVKLPLVGAIAEKLA